jgi:hypothetical protein
MIQISNNYVVLRQLCQSRPVCLEVLDISYHTLQAYLRYPIGTGADPANPVRDAGGRLDSVDSPTEQSTCAATVEV